MLSVGTLHAQESVSQTDVTAAVEAAKKAPRNQALNRAAGDALKNAGRYA